MLDHPDRSTLTPAILSAAHPSGRSTVRLLKVHAEAQSWHSCEAMREVRGGYSTQHGVE